MSIDIVSAEVKDFSFHDYVAGRQERTPEETYQIGSDIASCAIGMLNSPGLEVLSMSDGDDFHTDTKTVGLESGTLAVIESPTQPKSFLVSNANKSEPRTILFKSRPLNAVSKEDASRVKDAVNIIGDILEEAGISRVNFALTLSMQQRAVHGLE